MDNKFLVEFPETEKEALCTKMQTELLDAKYMWSNVKGVKQLAKKYLVVGVAKVTNYRFLAEQNTVDEFAYLHYPDPVVYKYPEQLEEINEHIEFLNNYSRIVYA